MTLSPAPETIVAASFAAAEADRAAAAEVGCLNERGVLRWERDNGYAPDFHPAARARRRILRRLGQ